MIVVDQTENRLSLIPGAGATEDHMVVRRAQAADRAAIVAMYNTFEPKAACLGLPPREDPTPWLDRLAPYSNFVVEWNGRLVAHGALCYDSESGEVAVFVHQGFRNRRIGKLLLSALVEEGRRLGLRRLWGMTDLDNIPMLRLARSLGFISAEDPLEFYLEL